MFGVAVDVTNNLSFQCKLKLKCGIHECGLICHDRNKCPPCSKKSKRPCLCGNSTQERNCDDLVWQCDKKCNKLYQCSIHRCELKCHIGDCGDCPLGRPRECPCGKQVTSEGTESSPMTKFDARILFCRKRKRHARRKSVLVVILARKCWNADNISASNAVIRATALR